MIFFYRDGVVRQQLRRSLGLPPGSVQADLGLLALGLPPVEFGLVPARVNDKEHVTLPHQLSRLEAHFLNVTGDAWTHFDRFHRLGPAREFIPFDHFLPFHGRDRDGWRGRLMPGGWPTAAA